MHVPKHLLTLGLLAIPAVATAHARLVASSPAANATVAAPAAIDLHFSEAVIGKLSGADLTRAGKPAKLPATVASGQDPKSLHITTPKPLGRGDYLVTYHVVSADTHRVTGSFGFHVK